MENMTGGSRGLDSEHRGSKRSRERLGGSRLGCVKDNRFA